MRNYSMLVLSVIALALSAHAADQIQFMRDVNMNSNALRCVRAPVDAGDAASKGYVDVTAGKVAEAYTLVYVRKNGLDAASADGSLAKPFASVKDSLASIADASYTKRYLLDIGPGVYNESGIVFKPYVSVNGANKETTKIQDVTPITVNFGSGGRIRFSNITITGGLTVNADVTSGGSVVHFNDCNLNDTVTVNFRGSGIDYVEMHDTVCSGPVILHGAAVWNKGTYFQGTVQVDDEGATHPDSYGVLSLGYFHGCVFAGDVTASGNVWMDTHTSQAWADYNNGLQPGCMWEISEAGPIVGTLNGSGEYLLDGKAAYIAYDSTDSGLGAADVQSAIDALNTKTASAGSAYSNSFVLKGGGTMSGTIDMNGYGITNANYIEFGGKGILAKGDSIHFGGNLVVDGGSLDMNGGAITKAVIPPASLANAAKTSAFGINIENAGAAITAGSKGFVTVPYDCMITNWTLLADQSGSIVIDVKRSTYDAFPPTASIAGSAKPTLSSVQKNQDYLLTGWTKDLAAGDVIEFVVDSAATVTRVNLSISVVKK